MAPHFITGRVLLAVVAGSYLLSAALLSVARWRGTPVPPWAIVGWLLAGTAGLVLTAALRPGRSDAWVGLLVVLGPWMLLSLAYDLRERVWVMSATDVAGLVAIGVGLWMTRAALGGSPGTP